MFSFQWPAAGGETARRIAFWRMPVRMFWKGRCAWRTNDAWKETRRRRDQRAQSGKRNQLPNYAPKMARLAKRGGVLACPIAEGEGLSARDFLDGVKHFCSFAAADEFAEREKSVYERRGEACFLHSCSDSFVGDGHVFNRFADRVGKNLHLVGDGECFGAGDGVGLSFVAFGSERANGYGGNIARMNRGKFSFAIIGENFTGSADRFAPVKGV